MSRTITFLHTLPQLIEVFDDLSSQHLPSVDTEHLVEREFYDAEFEYGYLNDAQQEKLVSLLNGAHPDGISVVTCSFLGTYVDRLRDRATNRWVRVDEAMARRAMQFGSSIAILATGTPPVTSTQLLFEHLGQELDQQLTLTPVVVDGAYDALIAGDRDLHNSLIREQVRTLDERGVDVFVFSQASMAQALEGMERQPSVPVLTSPVLCMEHLRELTADTDSPE